MLYDDGARWLSPLFDVVTTTVYSYERAGAQALAAAMRATLKAAKPDARIPRSLLKSLTSEWDSGTSTLDEPSTHAV